MNRESNNFFLPFLLFLSCFTLITGSPPLSAADERQEIDRRVCQPKCEDKRALKKMKCLRTCRNEHYPERKSQRALRDAARGPAKGESMPWGSKPPQTCNECVNAVAATCEKKCSDALKSRLAACRRTCANSYCADVCL